MAGKQPGITEKYKKLCVALGADHGGYSLKNELLARLQGQYDILDLGAHKYDLDDDYPDFAKAVAQAVASGKTQRGILVCGSGVGACIAANKVPGVRACLCIVPMFYQQPDAYTSVMRSAIALNGSFYNAQRMTFQYMENAYLHTD